MPTYIVKLQRSFVADDTVYINANSEEEAMKYAHKNFKKLGDFHWVEAIRDEVFIEGIETSENTPQEIAKTLLSEFAWGNKKAMKLIHGLLQSKYERYEDWPFHPFHGDQGEAHKLLEELIVQSGLAEQWGPDMLGGSKIHHANSPAKVNNDPLWCATKLNKFSGIGDPVAVAFYDDLFWGLDKPRTLEEDAAGIKDYPQKEQLAAYLSTNEIGTKEFSGLRKRVGYKVAKTYLNCLMAPKVKDNEFYIHLGNLLRAEYMTLMHLLCDDYDKAVSLLAEKLWQYGAIQKTKDIILRHWNKNNI